MKKISLVILLITAVTVNKLAAQQSMFSIQYSVGFGTGDMKEFICNASWRGMTLDYRYMLNGNKIGVGVSTGWNAFYKEKLNSTLTDGTQTLHGDRYNYCSVVPILGMVDYYFSPNQKINPFVGLGVGTAYSQDDVDMGLYTSQTETWHFCLQPEAGVIISPNPGFGFIIAAKYYSAFETSNNPARNYLAANLGFVWQY